MKRASVYVVAVLICLCAAVNGAPQIPKPENIPDDILPAIASAEFDQTYAINPSMNPFYLRGDFDGDGIPDYAVWIKAKKTGESGIAIRLSSRKNFVVLGAGTPFRFAESSTRDFANLDVWQVYGKRVVEEGVEAGPPPKLIGEAILVGKSESASGLIYWTGKSFKWYQQGD